jgi:tetratricopeptide (TPR) repeat protein
MAAAVVAALAALAVMAAGSTIARSSLWGAHHYGFLPPGVAVAALTAMLATLAWLQRGGATGSIWVLEACQALFTPGASRGLLIGTGAFAILVVGRIQHTLLGDGAVQLDSVVAGLRINPLEPLTSVIQYGLYRVFLTLPHPPDWTEKQIAFEALACGSFAAGVAFVFTVRGLARELTAHASKMATGGGGWVALLLLAQGYVQIFFGYIENYAYVLVACAWYLYASLAYLRGRLTSMLPAIVALVVACCLHLSAAALLPSVLVLFAHALRSPERRRSVSADLTATVLLVGGFMALLFASSGQLVGETLAGTVRGLGEGQWRWRDYALSTRHLLDLFNELWLIGPLGAPLALGFLVRRLRRRDGGSGAWFLVSALLPAMAVLWIADDSNLGYARNWDLLALFGFVLAVCGAYFMVEWLPEAVARRRVLIAAITVSLVHTVAWVSLNASHDRSIERFSALPLGLGRMESTLGAQYMEQGDLAKAEEWLIRSLDEHVGNARAHFFLGQVYLRTGRAERAVEAFEYALSLRPDRTDFNLGLLDALVRSARWDNAWRHLGGMIVRTPTADALWTARALLLARLGRWDDALECAQRSALLWEDHDAYRELTLAIMGKAPFPELMHRFWPEVSGIPWPSPDEVAGAVAPSGRPMWRPRTGRRMD